ncbi:MAG: membrane protein insertion efficiency factor YidD [Elusimicrobiota bacterium]
MIIKALFRKIIIIIIKGYQICISPFIGRRCRFYPSCSEYFIQSIEKKGIMPGFVNGISRVVKCHPFSKGGYDPVKD